MIKLQDFKFNKDVLLLFLCILGTAAVAWWAWAAGPVEPRSALGSAPQAETTQGLNGSGYGSLSPAGPGGSSGQSGGAASSSGNSSSPVTSSPINVYPEPDPLYPVDPTPKCSYYKYPEGAQSGATCPPYNCGAIRYPCCQYMDSPQGVCGCGGNEMLCASPL